MIIFLGILLSLAIAVLAYAYVERGSRINSALVVTRTVALSIIVLLLLNPIRETAVDQDRPDVFLDVSLSMNAAGGRWDEAVDSALSIGGSEERITVFGANDPTVTFDPSAPQGVGSELTPAARAAAGRQRSVVIITDGEIRDPVVAPNLLVPHRVIVLPRDTLPNVAILDAELPGRVLVSDTITVELTVGTWGNLDADSADVSIRTGGRQLANHVVILPQAPGRARIPLALPASLLAEGEHVLHLTISAEGDVEPSDDVRLRAVDVIAEPPILILVDPADAEGRFLIREMTTIAGSSVLGYQRVAGRWLDARTAQVVEDDVVNRQARSAGVVITRGAQVPTGLTAPIWRWTAAQERQLETFGGDWYASPTVPVSPLTRDLALVDWSELPPLTGVIPTLPSENQWVALRSQLNRRGVEQPLILGHDSTTRTLLTVGSGWWRWSLRGGDEREGYRAVLAAGLNWLLTAPESAAEAISVTRVVERGHPTRFTKLLPTVPDSVDLQVTIDDSTFTSPLVFDGNGVAQLLFPPGNYRWSIPAVGSSGLAIVEPYSSEIPIKTVSVSASSGVAQDRVDEHPVRKVWWLFALAIGVLLGEWGVRQRRGLA